MTTRARAIEAHVHRLQRIFTTTTRDRALWDKLRRLEREARRAAERHCNEPTPEDFVERVEASILGRLDALLHFRARGIPVFMNWDPRGCALKISGAYIAEQRLDLPCDWGGFGLIAPRF